MLIPLERIKNMIGKEIVVITKRHEYKGVLSGFDKNVNILLEKATEKGAEYKDKEIGSVLLNGENICIISSSF